MSWVRAVPCPAGWTPAASAEARASALQAIVALAANVMPTTISDASRTQALLFSPLATISSRIELNLEASLALRTP
jgi:hypothetical protein